MQMTDGVWTRQDIRQITDRYLCIVRLTSRPAGSPQSSQLTLSFHIAAKSALMSGDRHLQNDTL